MSDAHLFWLVLHQDRERTLVVGDSGHQRLSGVPQHGQRIGQERAGKYAFERASERGLAHALPGRSVRQVTISAIDVAKRRRLKNQHLNDRIVMISWHWGGYARALGNSMILVRPRTLERVSHSRNSGN